MGSLCPKTYIQARTPVNAENHQYRKFKKRMERNAEQVTSNKKISEMDKVTQRQIQTLEEALSLTKQMGAVNM